MITKERTEGGLNKGAYLLRLYCNIYCPFIQATFGFSELNKVAAVWGFNHTLYRRCLNTEGIFVA